MAKEWIDIVDTAVKIGFGSLISGFFTFVGIKVSKTSEKNKFILEHKVKILEQISSNAENYFVAWNGLISRLKGITKKVDHNQEAIILNESQLKWIKERDKQLIETWPVRQSCFSKLRLLKADEVVKKLQDCVSLENELRQIVIFDKNYPNYNKMTDYGERVKEIQKQFHEELARFYDEITNK